MRGDPDALERVLRNLIDNALAAIQPTGVIEVRLQRCNGCIQARVADDGPGVPEHQRERIFERFVRLDSTKPGHGLGLAIARRIAEQHHGDLTRDPTPNGPSFNSAFQKNRDPADEPEAAPGSHGHAKRGETRLLATPANQLHHAGSRMGRPPPHVHGKEGVDGSSPSEGFSFLPA